MDKGISNLTILSSGVVFVFLVAFDKGISNLTILSSVETLV